MNDKRWQQVRTIVEDALALAPDEQSRYVERACVGDTALLREVESLVAAEEPPSGFVEPPLEQSAMRLLSGLEDCASIGEMVGPYRLEALIAKGGMGTVYKAVRDDKEFKQVVAIKLIKPGMDSVEAVRRFRRERQVLATFEHPNIARLLDGAVTEEGAPYLVMEYVTGQSIDKYCDGQELDVKPRLKLFLDVCAAVQHAHQALVVHRDLKPSNILVTPDGVPKLLDFGIAKLLDPLPGTDAVDATLTALRLMTPQYASPEQIRGEPITTASDVYSLGVILYELLTGHRPYELSAESRAEMERVLCDVEPPTPSTAILRTWQVTLADGTTGAVTPETVSARRGTRPERLARSLRGDLDTIVLTAMHKDVARRYGSVAHLADDIDRYLKGLPVLARRDTFRYRASKFVRRNRVAVIASAIAVVALVTGAAGTTIGMVRARDALRESRHQTELARDEARKAEHVSSFLQDMLASASPEELGMDVTVRAVLDATSEGIDSKLEDEPEIRAVTHRTLGLTYLAIGLYKPARTHLESALELRRSVFGDKHIDTVQSRFDVGLVLSEEGEHAKAEQYFERAMGEWRKLAPNATDKVARSLGRIGIAHHSQGKLRSAERIQRRTVEMMREIHGDGSTSVATALNNLATTLGRLGENVESEAILRRVLDTHRPGVDETTELNIANWTGNLGAVLLDTGRYAEAAALSKQVLATRERQLGEMHPTTLTSLSNLAVAQMAGGNIAAAERNFRRALSRMQEVWGAENSRVAGVMIPFGQLLGQSGRLKEAEQLLRKSVSILRRRYGSTNLALAGALNNLGVLLRAKRDFAGARAAYDESLKISRNLLGDSHPDVRTALHNLGSCCLFSKDYVEAEHYLREALEIVLEPLGDEHPFVERTTRALADVVAGQNRFPEAEVLYRKTLAVQERLFGKDSRKEVDTKRNLALMRLRQHDPVGALRLIEESIALRDKLGGSSRWAIAHADGIYGECLYANGHLARAEPMLLRSFKVLSQGGDDFGDEKYSALLRIVGFYEASQRPEKAAEYRAMLPNEEASPAGQETTKNANVPENR